MNPRSQDWRISAEYPGAAFGEHVSQEVLDQHGIKYVIHRTSDASSLWVFMNELNTTIGEALRRIAPRLDNVRALLSYPSEPASITVGQLGHSRREELVSLSEIAELLKVTRQRAQQLSKHADFPRPRGGPEKRPLYSLIDVERYRTERADKPRTRKT